MNTTGLCLPSFNATNSLISDVDTTLTNIFATPLIPGSASSYSAIYSALIRAQHISTWACGESSRVVVSLDLDLYEKAYSLVRCDPYLRERFVLCLGELHVVFAHIRVIGNYISCSGLDNAWMAAEWFDSPCLLRQVLECLNMKRAIATLEPTVVAIGTLTLREVVSDFKDEIGVKGNALIQIIDAYDACDLPLLMVRRCHWIEMGSHSHGQHFVTKLNHWTCKVELSLPS